MSDSIDAVSEDPDDMKPEDWVDAATISDPDAKKVCPMTCRVFFMIHFFRSPRTGMRMHHMRSSTKRP